MHPFRLAPSLPVAAAAVLARNVVATSQPLAAQAGMAMLPRGGNAVDAALATAIALTVVEPCSNGLGSDLFAIVWDGRELAGLNASGRAPAAWYTPRASPACARCRSEAGKRSRSRARYPVGRRCRNATASCRSATCSRRRSATRATASPCRPSSPKNGRSPPPCCRTTSASPSTFCPAAGAPHVGERFACPGDGDVRWKRSPPRTAKRSTAASSPQAMAAHAAGARRAPHARRFRRAHARLGHAARAATIGGVPRSTRFRPTARGSPR